MAPLSALVPAYNAAATLARALDSIAAQTCAVAETIVVDDGSSDATAAVAAAHALRPRVIRHEGNRGSSAALATALGAARHDVVAFLDADDAWAPGKIAAQLDALGPDTAFVATGFTNRAPDGRARWTYGAEGTAREGPDFWKALLEHSMVAKPSVLTRASWVARAGGFDPAMAVAEDQDLWIRLALLGPVRYLAQPLVDVFDGPASLGKRQRAPDLAFVLPMVERHLTAQAARLGADETRRIRQRRYAAATANLIDAGLWREALAPWHVAVANGAPAWPPLVRLARRAIGA